MQQLDQELANLHERIEPALESIAPRLADLPLVMTADGVSVPFRPQQGTAKGKIRFREVKIALLARLQLIPTRSRQLKTRLEQR